MPPSAGITFIFCFHHHRASSCFPSYPGWLLIGSPEESLVLPPDHLHYVSIINCTFGYNIKWKPSMIFFKPDIIALMSHQKLYHQPDIWGTLLFTAKTWRLSSPVSTQWSLLPPLKPSEREKDWEALSWAFSSFSTSTVLAYQWVNLFLKSTSKDFKCMGSLHVMRRSFSTDGLNYTDCSLKVCPLVPSHLCTEPENLGIQPKLAKLLPDLQHLIFTFLSESQI